MRSQKFLFFKTIKKLKFVEEDHFKLLFIDGKCGQFWNY